MAVTGLQEAIPRMADRPKRTTTDNGPASLRESHTHADDTCGSPYTMNYMPASTRLPHGVVLGEKCRLGQQPCHLSAYITRDKVLIPNTNCVYGSTQRGGKYVCIRPRVPNTNHLEARKPMILESIGGSHDCQERHMVLQNSGTLLSGPYPRIVLLDDWDGPANPRCTLFDRQNPRTPGPNPHLGPHLH
ncbi:hypothetical protein CONLIGDRAFT_45236 [Coniochaeta ligniaria NRRL 30616]|uniref:Uncharacterized protein n=1 Tax=Coniochaeta ligniaria NRRL 30616 TaxID=1408157 RepID=A0A1J7K0E0_9PEZI|nr:hypothetical protein CONLIGDRAFT_45236 [Coniochaeta ligniaria NRRL 30616]